MTVLTAGPGHDDGPVPGAVRVLEVPVAVDPGAEESHVEQDEEEGETEILEVVSDVRDGELMRNPLGEDVVKRVVLLGLGRHQPAVDGDGEVLQRRAVS